MELGPKEKIHRDFLAHRVSMEQWWLVWKESNLSCLIDGIELYVDMFVRTETKKVKWLFWRLMQKINNNKSLPRDLAQNEAIEPLAEMLEELDTMYAPIMSKFPVQKERFAQIVAKINEELHKEIMHEIIIID